MTGVFVSVAVASTSFDSPFLPESAVGFLFAAANLFLLDRCKSLKLSTKFCKLNFIKNFGLVLNFS